MQTVLIANPKGGSGKSTLATNLAGYFAWQGELVMLGDIDRQQTRHWLGLRPETHPNRRLGTEDREPARPPRNDRRGARRDPAGLRQGSIRR